MKQQSIKTLLKQINLNFDVETISAIEDFLLKQVGFISDIQIEYQIYGAAAIVSEVLRLPNVGKEGQSTNGIRIESVMRHLGSLSKQRYLDTLNNQLQKLRKPPQKLKKRIQDIRYSYRFYKKYQTTFSAIYDKLFLATPTKQEFSALFWVLYLYVKNSCIQTENIREAMTLLILLLRMVFQNFISNAKLQDISHLITANIGLIPQITQQSQNFYFNQLQNKINHFYSARFSQQNVNFHKLLNSYIYVDRLVDDMSNAYAKEQSSLKYYNQIDELSYLQLKKNLTPQVFRKVQPTQNLQMIGKTLSFDDDSDEQNFSDDDMQYQSTPTKVAIIQGNKDNVSTPNFLLSVSPSSTPIWKPILTPKTMTTPFFQDSAYTTPISKKIQNQIWMKRRMQCIGQNELNQFRGIFQNLFKSPYLQFQTDIKQRNMQTIKDFTPKCRDCQSRNSQIYSFFIMNCSQIQKQTKNLFVVQNINLLKGIACLSAQLFNYINNSISSQYKHHCQVFGIDIFISVKSLSLFSMHVSYNMPFDLKQYLQKATKLLMVSQIWQNQEGFKILCEHQNPNNPQFACIAELYRFIVSNSQKRINQISGQVSIQSKIIAKTKNMIKFIFQKKPYLLRRNNLDQIVLCCLMSCLSMNQKQDQNTLENLFIMYNSNIQFAYNQNQNGLRDSEGNQMKIIDYYNQVFLAEIQDMLTLKLDHLDDFLLTPLRISNKGKLPSWPAKIQKTGTPATFIFNPEKSAKQRKSGYLLSLIKKNSEMKEQKQEEDGDLPSPSFGVKNLYKKHTLGP